jgi:hypothetical protein
MHASVFKPKKKKPPSKFFTKSTSQNYWKIEIPVVNNWPKPFYFDQRTKLWSIYVWIHQEPWQYPINTPCKIKKRREKEGGNMGKHTVKRSWCKSSRTQHKRSNKLWKKKIVKGKKKKEKRRKTTIHML